MSGKACRHPDIRKFDGLRCCLACGETDFEAPTQTLSTTSTSIGISHYEYTNLNYKLGREIRLCILLPGEPYDQLQCEISHVNLEDDPDFEAVSYTWADEDGNASLSRSIYCGNNKYVRITKNCDYVLRQLRMRGSRRRLWVDAICINQSSLGERNHQVGFMDQIYAQAKSVRICIEDDSIPLDCVDYKSLFHDLRSGCATLDGMFWESLEHLLSRRYFRRVWVIQEVVLARAAYLHVGDEELLLSSAVMEGLKALATQSKYSVPGVLRMRWTVDQTPLPDIVSCLRAGFEGESTDPRDHIFAILSFMSPHARALFTVDYHTHPIIVYTNAVTALMLCHQDLDLISIVSCGNSDNWQFRPALTIDQFRSFLKRKDVKEIQKTESQSNVRSRNKRVGQFTNDMIGRWRRKVQVIECLPTPEWHAPGHVLCNKSDQIVNWRRNRPPSSRKTLSIPEHAPGDVFICHRSQQNLARSNDLFLASANILPTLVLRAHYIDTIDDFVYQLDERHPNHVVEDRPLTRKDIPSMAMNIAIRSFFQKSAMLAPNDSASNILHRLASETTDPRDNTNMADLNTFMQEAKNIKPSDAAFSTTHSIGFAPPIFRAGDQVWAVDGARTPFILRQTRDDTFRIVCDCYLWAALELDHWNLGTKKGKWGENHGAHQRRQTRIIEIH